MYPGQAIHPLLDFVRRIFLLRSQKKVTHNCPRKLKNTLKSARTGTDQKRRVWHLPRCGHAVWRWSWVLLMRFQQCEAVSLSSCLPNVPEKSKSRKAHLKIPSFFHYLSLTENSIIKISLKFCTLGAKSCVWPGYHRVVSEKSYFGVRTPCLR